MSRCDLVIGPWGARYMGRSFGCSIGRGGIGEKRAEGDGITPAGQHRIEAVWFRRDRISVRLPYAQRLPGVRKASAAAPSLRVTGPEDGWSDDPADPDYNRAIRRPHGFRSEKLARPDGLYDLVAVLDWNRHPPVPGKGSAIFLHVWRRPRYPTEGCIALARHDLTWVLAHWKPASRVVVRAV